MDNSLLYLMLIALHTSWAALPLVDKVNTITTNFGLNEKIPTSTIRRFTPTNDIVTSHQSSAGLPTRIPGPQGPQGSRPVITPPKPAPTSANQAGNTAFMVYKTNAQVGNRSDILTFDSVATNVGNNFDVSTGVFTCTTPGMYILSFTIITPDYPIINLCKNEEILASVFRSYDGAGLYDTVSNQAVVQLAAGDQVFLMFLGYDEQSVYGDTYYKYTTFSGYQLY